MRPGAFQRMMWWLFAVCAVTRHLTKVLRCGVLCALLTLGWIASTVAATGDITTVAGTGQAGDGGPAIAAQFSGPLGVFVDSMGNLYIGVTFPMVAAMEFAVCAGLGSRPFLLHSP